jgi:hypothetical protein
MLKLLIWFARELYRFSAWGGGLRASGSHTIMLLDSEACRQPRPLLSVRRPLQLRLWAKQSPSHVTLDELSSEMVVSFLGTDQLGAHRAVARSFVGERASRTYVMLKQPAKHAAVCLDCDSEIAEAEEDAEELGGGSSDKEAEEDAEEAPEEDEEPREATVHTEMCQLCGIDFEWHSDDEDSLCDTSHQMVAILKMRTYLHLEHLPKSALKFLWKKKQFAEMQVLCSSGESIFRCCDRYLLEHECTDEQDVKDFWEAAAAN